MRPQLFTIFGRSCDCLLLLAAVVITVMEVPSTRTAPPLQPEVNSSSPQNHLIARNGIPRRREGGGTRHTG